MTDSRVVGSVRWDALPSEGPLNGVVSIEGVIREADDGSITIEVTAHGGGFKVEPIQVVNMIGQVNDRTLAPKDGAHHGVGHRS